MWIPPEEDFAAFLIGLVMVGLGTHNVRGMLHDRRYIFRSLDYRRNHQPKRYWLMVTLEAMIPLCGVVVLLRVFAPRFFGLD